MVMIKNTLCGLNPEEIYALIGNSGYNLSHAVSITKSMYRQKITEISQISKIPKKLTELLASSISPGIYPPVHSAVSKDKSVKFLFRTETGKAFETVYIPDGKRKTVCVSTQSGCRMGCLLCQTGRYGFYGNLSVGEIVNQVLSIPDAGDINHVVFMGMGEPMDNLENVLKACEILTSDWGMALSPRNITVSTVGLTPGVRRFLAKSDCNLTLSLHSPFSEERRHMVPVENKYPVDEIIALMKEYHLRKKRRLSLAYVMIKDTNDTDLHLHELITHLKDSQIRINLLPYHNVAGDSFVSSSAERMLFFKHNLILSGVSASIRKSRGADIMAACGLLASDLKI